MTLREHLEAIVAMHPPRISSHGSVVREHAEDALKLLDADDALFALELRWTCEECGWTHVVAAPGFAGDGRWHYINGHRRCGPITAQKETT